MQETNVNWNRSSYCRRMSHFINILPEILYVICCVIGYLFFGLGLGIYATPSTDTAIANAPLEK